jgi:hypothetical protein
MASNIEVNHVAICTPDLVRMAKIFSWHSN